MTQLDNALPERLQQAIRAAGHFGSFDSSPLAEKMRAVHLALMRYYGVEDWQRARDKRSRYGK